MAKQRPAAKPFRTPGAKLACPNWPRSVSSGSDGGLCVALRSMAVVAMKVSRPSAVHHFRLLDLVGWLSWVYWRTECRRFPWTASSVKQHKGSVSRRRGGGRAIYLPLSAFEMVHARGTSVCASHISPACHSRCRPSSPAVPATPNHPLRPAQCFSCTKVQQSDIFNKSKTFQNETLTDFAYPASCIVFYQDVFNKWGVSNTARWERGGWEKQCTIGGYRLDFFNSIRTYSSHPSAHRWLHDLCS